MTPQGFLNDSARLSEALRKYLRDDCGSGVENIYFLAIYLDSRGILL